MNFTKRFSSTFKIYRNNKGKVKMDSFQFDKKKVGPMVLDGLNHIKNNLDKTLGFRRSCRGNLRFLRNEYKRQKYTRLFNTDRRQKYNISVTTYADY